MSNPVNVALPAGQWTKVATRVQGAQLYIKNNYSRKFYMTYRLTGDDAPVDLTDTIIFDRSGFETIDTANAVDVYIFCSSVFNLISGSVRVSIGQDRDVSIQDQHTRPLDLYFTTTTGQGAATTLAVDTTINASSIEVADVTNLQLGQFFGMFGGDPNVPQFYFGTVVAVPIGNVIQIDSLMDSVFTAGVTILPLSKNIAVDGSVTPVTFSIQAGGAGGTIEVDLTRIMGVMETASAVDLNKFGSGLPLVRGISLRRKNGILENLWNVKRNRDFSLITFDYEPFLASNPSQGVDGLSFRNSYAGPSKHGVTIRLEPGDSLDLVVSDDLTIRATFFEMMAQGHYVEL